MTLTYVYAISPASGTAFGPSAGAAFGAAGKSYTPNAAGIITGVAASDAILMTGVNANLQLLLATGTTADRPDPSPSPPIGPGINNFAPAPTLGLAFYDSSLSKTVWYVGFIQSATGWVDQTGASA